MGVFVVNRVHNKTPVRCQSFDLCLCSRLAARDSSLLPPGKLAGLPARSPGGLRPPACRPIMFGTALNNDDSMTNRQIYPSKRKLFTVLIVVACERPARAPS